VFSLLRFFELSNMVIDGPPSPCAPYYAFTDERHKVSSRHYDHWRAEQTSCEFPQIRSLAVAVVEAQAKFDAASKLAEAEVARARGVAQANQIIGDSLKGNEAYLRYLWINNLDGKGDKQVIYVPTEAGLPILEAGRLKAATAQ
jgi:hypothetical protein